MTDEEIISRSTAEALLGAYGADPKRWPAEWREALDRAIAYHVGLKELVEQQAALDRDLIAYSVTSLDHRRRRDGACWGRTSVEGCEQQWLARGVP